MTDPAQGPMPADLGPPERHRRGGVDIEVRDRTSAGHVYQTGARVAAECKLDVYLRRRIIDSRQFGAGMRMRHTAERAGILQRVTANLLGSGPSHQGEIAGIVIDARADLEAMRLVIGRALAPLVEAVCVYDEWASDVEHAKSWPRKSGVTFLREGLDVLAEYLRCP